MTVGWTTEQGSGSHPSTDVRRGKLGLYQGAEDPATSAALSGRPAGRGAYRDLKQSYRKQSISRQADLVQLVLSLAELG